MRTPGMTIPVPKLAAIIGAQLYWLALVHDQGSRLTNVQLAPISGL